MSKIRIIFTRHAERLPSGNLSAEGLKRAETKGKALKKDARAILSYSSDHPSKRAYDTAKIIADASEIIQLPEDSLHKIKEVKDFSYDIFSPDLKHFLVEVKNIIDEATLNEIGLSAEKDESGKFINSLEELPESQQQEVAQIRQKNQVLGFDFWLNQPDVVNRLAICMAHRLIEAIDDSKNYEIHESIISNNVGHGCFAEALFEKAGVSMVNDKSILGVSLMNNEHGGFIQPLESFYFEIDSQKDMPELIPIYIEKTDGTIINEFSLSYEKLCKLDGEYKAWAKSRS